MLFGTLDVYRSDIYSYGVILWELVTEKIPWDNLNSMQVLFSLIKYPDTIQERKISQHFL